MKKLIELPNLVVRFPNTWTNNKTEITWMNDDSIETFLSLEQTIELRDFLNDIIENFPKK
jgi:hypothetical protein